jgi:23S rRNA G2445 N2-methylase RlmL
MHLHKNFLVPWFPTNPLVVEEMLKTADVAAKDVVCDPACGDGRVLVRAVQEPFNARYAIGIDIDEYWTKTALERIKELNLQDRIKIINADMLQRDLSSTDVLFLYMSRHSNEEIRSKLEKELKRSARVISHCYEMERWKPLKVKEVSAPIGDDKKHPCPQRIYLYRMDEI